jgi:transposase InsO family protein
MRHAKVRQSPAESVDDHRLMLSDGEFRNHAFEEALRRLGARHTLFYPGRPQSNGCVERAQRAILEECWKPAFALYLIPKHMDLRRELERYLRYYNFDRARTGRLTQGRMPADALGAANMYR